MFDFVFEVANDEQRGELDAAIDLISWGLEFETGCKAQSWKQIHKYTISGEKTKIHNPKGEAREREDPVSTLINHHKTN